MKKPRIFFRIILTILLFNALLTYLGWNVSVYAQTLFPAMPGSLIWTLFFVLSYSYILSRAASFLSFLRLVGSLMFGFFQYAIVLFPLANMGVWIATVNGVPSYEAITWVGHVTAIVFILLFVYGMFNAYSPVVRKYTITVPKSGAKISSLRITMASDMHFGRLSGVAHAKKLVKEVNLTNPDIILLAGDVIDDELDPFLDKNMGDILHRMKAPLGVYGVLGNHEYYGGQVKEYIEEMDRIGIRILTDEVILVDHMFYIIGRKDKTDHNRLAFEQLTVGLDRELPIVAMDHQPSELHAASEAMVDVLFSGHTHRGQMAPNHLITRKLFELDWGYAQKNTLHAFVSSGYGFWGPPIRIGSRSEILQVDVLFESN